MNVYLVSSDEFGDYFNFLVQAEDRDSALDLLNDTIEDWIENNCEKACPSCRGPLKFNVDLVLTSKSPIAYLGDDERGVRECAEVLPEMIKWPRQ